MNRDRVFKDAIYAQISRAGRALAHPRRLELLDLLCQGPMTVDRLARKSAMSLGNTSQHLQHLKEAQLVRVEVRGTHRVYHLNDGATCDLFRMLRSYAEQHYADMQAISQAFLHDREALEAVDASTLHRRLQEEVVLLDVRPSEEFAAGHWPGAISMPPGGPVHPLVASAPKSNRRGVLSRALLRAGPARGRHVASCRISGSAAGRRRG